MAPLLLWTAVLAAVASLGSVGVSAMPMLTDPQAQRQVGAEPFVPTAILEWYLQQRDLQQRDLELDQPPVQQLQPSELRQQFKEWLATQIARLPAPVEAEDPNKALVGPPQPKRGNYMALCHFKICNMGRKRSGRLQSQDLP
ncbi:Cytochrome P450 monooxygenase sirE [Frankliniella fusca]|uniref:Cytochrome P450 monooxygenase sirE n=1 Tax=Frankliniella fusca TaxID=407009 RepID=A0AAE1GTL6_9NEOP|nr:Cytochrome P450 monooxygenase sirE [Frankliniella fusca]